MLTPETMTCKHCGDAVIFTGHTAKGFDTDYLHANMIRRCLPAKSGQPYGLEADISHEREITLKLISQLETELDITGSLSEEPKGSSS